jgi:transposase InsO family protein
VRRPAIKLNPAELEELKRVLQQLLDAGHIRPSSSSYAAPVMFVKKADGGLRFVADYRLLNKQTVRQAPQIPRIDEIVQQIGGSKCLTKLDLVNGYWQVKMAEGSVAKTCITTRYGNFEWLVMPMGLSNAPSAWMKLMNSVLHPVIDRCCIVYMDDLLVYSRTPEQHLKDLDEVLGLLGGAGLACKPSKCSFAQQELTYVGFRVSGAGVAADPAKVAPIRDWPTPTTPHQVRQFVGLANYYRRFIRHFADIAKPLYLLLKGADSSKAAGSRPFPSEAWGEQQQQAFQQLKDALTSTPVLAIYDPALPCRVTTDASDFAVGGVIEQLSSDQKWHPVAYASRALNAAEQNYHTTERENLALVYCLDEWQHMLVGSPHVVLCQTDHDALKDLLTKPTLSRREARWVTMLADYQLQVVHIPGSSNAVGDPLSRRPDYARMAPKDGVPDGIKLARRFGLDLGDGRVCEKSSSRAASSPSPPLVAALAVTEVQLAAAAVAVKQDVAFLRQVRRACKTDPQTKAVLERLAACEVIPPARQYAWELKDGLLWRVGPGGGRRLFLPADSELQLRVLQQFHDEPTAGHRGYTKTLQGIRRFYDWAGIHAVVQQYCSECPQCQANKASNQKPAGQAQPLPIPERPWEQISMDFIMDLPASGKLKYTAVAVVVDRFSKMAVFFPCHTTSSAPEVAELFIERVQSYYGVPSAIVSDRDVRFVSRFRSSLLKQLGVKQQLSTANYPQTDGQTERVNRVLEEMLRNHCSTNQRDWSKFLGQVQTAYNSSISESTGFAPFEMVYGRVPPPPAALGLPQLHQQQQTPGSSSSSERVSGPAAAAEGLVKQLQETWRKAKLSMRNAQLKQAKAINQQRSKQVFKAGDQVYLKASHVRNIPAAVSRKLLAKWLGPFPIVRMRGPAAAELELPNTMNIHPVVHVSNLKPSQRSDRFGPRVAPPPDAVVIDGEIEEEVEDILDKRVLNKGRRVEYLVQWKGLPLWEASWEPKSHLTNCKGTLQAFEARACLGSLLGDFLGFSMYC